MVLEVHREEKILRANSAAIAVEDIAAADPQGDGDFATTQTPSKSPKSPRHRGWKTEAALFSLNGDVRLISNPLKAQKQILCPQCRLPQWIEPPIGSNRPSRDPNIEYCARRPLVNIPGHDVHGVPFPRVDAKGDRRKRQKTGHSQSQEAGSTFESPGPPSPQAEIEKKKKPIKKEGYPEVTCKRCGYKCGVNIYGRHLSKCMGIGGRASGRAAALKMNGEANGGRGTSTPPISRKSTPLPPIKKSPSKRATSTFEDEDEDDYEDPSPRKKIRKKMVKKARSSDNAYGDSGMARASGESSKKARSSDNISGDIGITRAVDSWRNSNQDPRLRSRRVRRMAKISSRKAMNTAPHGAHMQGPTGPGPTGMPPSGLGAPGPRQPMSMGQQLVHHHHEQPGGPPGGTDDVSGMFHHQM